jgi:xanthine dehydrogenase YagS FAD-binding subunit
VQAELPPFEHVDAATVEEAVHWLQRYGRRARLLAGGTDLLGLLKDRIAGPALPLPEMLVNVKRVPELRRIAANGDGALVIGGAVTLAEVEEHSGVRAGFPALAEAAASVGTTQIRSVGTVGGNLCQRPWCSYFRHPEYVCFKRGGRQCYAITGANRYYFSVTNLGICVMSHPSDLAPALIALEAQAVVAGPGGRRRVALERFFQGPRAVEETVLGEGELLVAVEVPAPAPGTVSVFRKQRVRDTWDFALAEVAVALRQHEGVCEEVRVVLGGVAPAPARAVGAEEVLRGRPLDAAAIAAAAACAVQRPRPLAMNGYKVQITKALVRRALRAAAGSEGGRTV